MVDLDRASTRLGMVIDNTADAVIFTSPSGRVLEWNKAAENMFGPSREEAIGANVMDHFVSPGNAEAVLATTINLQPGAITELSLPMIVQERTIPVLLRVACVGDNEGQVIGFVTVAHDDTPRLFARHAHETFANLDPAHAMENFADVLHTFIPFDNLSLAAIADGRFRELARVTHREAWGDVAFVRVDDSDLIEGPIEAAGLQAVSEAPYMIIAGSNYGQFADDVNQAGVRGSIVLTLRDPLSGAVSGLLVVGFADEAAASVPRAEALARLAPDLSQAVNNMLLYEQERQTSERLLDLDELRESFLALVAHEVRSPLAAIETSASVLRDHSTSLDETTVEELAAGIAIGARHLARLTGDLVDATRSGDGRFPCDIVDIDDFGSVVTTAALVAAADQRDRVEVTVQSGIRLRGDVGRLAQVVTNLVSNAVEVHVRRGRSHDDATGRRSCRNGYGSRSGHPSLAGEVDLRAFCAPQAERW